MDEMIHGEQAKAPITVDEILEAFYEELEKAITDTPFTPGSSLMGMSPGFVSTWLSGKE